MKAKKVFEVLLFVTVSNSFAQVPKAGSGRDAANFIPMRERVLDHAKVLGLEKRERTSDDTTGTRCGYVDYPE
jgi:hypothetical protein